MDTPSGFRNPDMRGRSRGKGRQQPHNTELFDDTSTSQHGYGPPPSGFVGYDPHQQTPGGASSTPMVPGQQLFTDPMVANMAMQYGSSLADQGKDYMHKNIEKYISPSKLKYYFAVDTVYVGKKLALLLFPFTHKDWSIRYSQDEPVAPRYEINAPDLYIPVMAFVTYILVAGVALGTNNKFTPEQLGIQSSSALVWLIIEILAVLFTLYVMNVNSNLKYLDLIAYCGYKYVGMIVTVLSDLMFQSTGYYLALLWTSITLAVFLMRTLKSQLFSGDAENITSGNKRRLYLLLFIALLQPVFMWWLTFHLMYG